MMIYRIISLVHIFVILGILAKHASADTPRDETELDASELRQNEGVQSGRPSVDKGLDDTELPEAVSDYSEREQANDVSREELSNAQSSQPYIDHSTETSVIANVIEQSLEDGKDAASAGIVTPDGGSFKVDDSAIVVSGDTKDAVITESTSSHVHDSSASKLEGAVDVVENQVNGLHQYTDENTELQGENDVDSSIGSSSDSVQDVAQGVVETESNGEQSITNSFNTEQQSDTSVVPESSENELNIASEKSAVDEGEQDEQMKPEDIVDKEVIDHGGELSATSFVEHYLFAISDCISVIDPWLQSAIDSLPPVLQKLFTNAPVALSPPRCLLLFSLSSLTALLLLGPVTIQCLKQTSRRQVNPDVSEVLFSAKRELLVAKQENEDLKKTVENLTTRLQDLEGSSRSSTVATTELTSERDQLRKKTERQSKELEELKSSVESQKAEIKQLTDTNKSLTRELQQLKEHTATIETQLYELQSTLQQSQSSALEMQSQLQSMTEEIAMLQTSKDQLLAEADGCTEKMKEMSEELSNLHEEQKLYQESINLKDCELNELRQCFYQLKSFEEEIQNLKSHEGSEVGDTDDSASQHLKDRMQEKMKEMLDVAQVNAKLTAKEEECQSYQRALAVEVESRIKLEELLKVSTDEMSKLMESRREAEQQVNAAKVKMDVLSNFFKEKEKELNRKLSEQEAREKANVDQLVNHDVRSKEFEAMVRLYKEQVDDLQKEIQKIESDYRRQVAAQEKKAHESWLSARQSERELKEQKMEAQLLRQKIVDLQTQLSTMSAETSVTAVETANETGVALPPAGTNLPTDRPLPIPRGMPPPFLIRPRPFFPPPPPFFHRPPFMPPGERPPMRYNEQHSSPVPPPMFDRRYPPEARRSSPSYDTWSPPRGRSPPPLSYSPRDRDRPPMGRYSPPRGDRDGSPPYGRSPSPTTPRGRHVSPPSLQRGGRPHSPPQDFNREPPAVMRPRPQIGAVPPPPASNEVARSPFQPGYDRTPGPPRWSSSPA